jgi:hypothetical protein
MSPINQDATSPLTGQARCSDFISYPNHLDHFCHVVNADDVRAA